MRIKINIFVPVIALLALTGCKKTSTPAPKKTPTGPTTDVYVVGYINPAANKYEAVYWKNGSIHPLTDGSNYAQGLGIAVSGTDVYVAGYRATDTIGIYRAICWKNGVAQILNNNSSEACAVAVNGTDVHVTGFLSEKTKFVGAYWKNGAITRLADDSLGSLGYAIAVNGTDVYVAGSTAVSAGNARYVATYWKNGVPVKLATANNSNTEARAIALNGSNVYVAGNSVVNNTDSIRAVYWNNGASSFLTPDNLTNSTAAGIALQNTDVYISGTLNIKLKSSTAAYWKNGTPVNVSTSSNSYVDAVAVQGSDVYVAGEKNGYPMYWKNGVAVVLSSQLTGNATGIVIVQNSN